MAARAAVWAMLLIAHAAAVAERAATAANLCTDVSANATVLRVVACDQQRPWTFTQAGGAAVVGSEVDLLKQVCSFLGLRFRIASASLAEALVQLERGDADVLLCGRVIDGQRDLVADFSDPHTISGQQMARRAESVRTRTLARMVRLIFTGRSLFFLAAAFTVAVISAVLVAVAEKRCNSLFRPKDASEATNMLQTLEWALGIMVPITGLRICSLVESSFSRVVASVGGMAANLLLAAFAASAVSAILIDTSSQIVPFEPTIVKDLTVGVVQGGIAARLNSGEGSWSKDFQAIRSLVTFPTLHELLVALSGGRIDAAIHEAQSLQAQLSDGAANSLYMEELVLASAPSRSVYIGFEFPRDSPFRVPINRALQALGKAGQLREQQVFLAVLSHVWLRSPMITRSSATRINSCAKSRSFSLLLAGVSISHDPTGALFRFGAVGIAKPHCGGTCGWHLGLERTLQSLRLAQVSLIIFLHPQPLRVGAEALGKTAQRARARTGCVLSHRICLSASLHTR
jgi:ABC-type amino acid transport substrate-binding protein